MLSSCVDRILFRTTFECRVRSWPSQKEINPTEKVKPSIVTHSGCKWEVTSHNLKTTVAKLQWPQPQESLLISKIDSSSCCSFSVNLLLPWLPGCTEAWYCMQWHAVRTVVMKIVPCLGSSQGGKWRGFPKPQPHVHGNPQQSHLILAPCLA